jgi:stearoyl-CoA desaturase (Delta-9 desaturase)
MLTTVILGFLWSQVISHFAISIGLHRYFSHGQIKVSPIVESMMLYMIMLACVRTPIGWIASHRMHHDHCDSDKDPHSPKFKGFWRVLLTTWSLDRIPPSYARDLYKNPRLVWSHKYWRHFLVLNWLGSLAIGVHFFIGYALMPFILARVGFGLLNTVGHGLENGVNRPWLNWIIAGEGYHRIHHQNCGKLRLHKYDTGGWLAERLFESNTEKPQREVVGPESNLA